MSEDRRLSIATRLAAGMLANPRTYEMKSFEAEVAITALRIADRMIAQHMADIGHKEERQEGITPLPYLVRR